TSYDLTQSRNHSTTLFHVQLPAIPIAVSLRTTFTNTAPLTYRHTSPLSRPAASHLRVARGLLDESVLKLVVTRGVDVANLTHLGRGPSAAQRIALRWASPTCSVEGCNAVRTQVDHRLGWAETHHTRLDELDPLCKPHHDRKTYDGWALVEGTGKRAMVPPGDPRHPGRLRPQERPPPTAGDETLFDESAA